jgi:hypothetical protein
MKLSTRGGGPISGSGRSAAGKGCMTAFFLIFLVMGLAATAAVGVQAAREAAVWLWPEVPCLVRASGVDTTGDDSAPYRPTIRFEYTADGRNRESRTVARGDLSSSSYDDARRIADRFPAGSRAICRVNPDDPNEAALEAHPPLIAFAVLLTLVFVAVGAGGLWMVWRPERPENGLATRSISQRAGGGGATIELAVGLIFTAVGGVLTALLLVMPLTRLALALDWIETPAEVVSSTVRSWSTDDGTSHRADVLYNYHAGGRSWTSNRTSFFPMSSSGYDDCREIVERYREGRDVNCWVDPDDPSVSVLDRAFRPVYLIGLFPLVFLIAGLALTAHSRRRRSSTVPGASPTASESETRVVAEATLEPAAGPVAKVFAMLVFALLWNGIVSVFIWQVVEGFRNGSPEWFLAIFMIPFVLVGLALIGGVLYALLGAANPRPRLVIAPSSPRLGGRLRLSWTFSGAVRRIDRLTMSLEGHEKATYRRGTDTITDREVFASTNLVDTTSEWEIAQGNVEADIPVDTMHSFSSDNNAVVWSIHLHGEVPRWPDVIESFPLEVRPMSRKDLLP